ncbi:MAG: hypothetical protein R3182_01305, partial [Draconibacterium sp.]|nr:hypothetical protein [Draconibacterium sp.]
VKILFSESLEISEERMMSVSVRLAGLVRNISQTKKSTTFYTDHLTGKSLPEGLEEVLVVNHPNLRTGVWEPSNNLGISNNVLDDIKRTISKKDEKLRLYHKSHLNLYWLLITTDRLRGIKNFNLPNLIQNHNFESQFQKVFLFDLIKAQIFTLV